MWLQVMNTRERVSYETESRLFKGRRISVRTFPYRDGVATPFVNMTERERLRAKAETSKSLSAAIEQSGLIATAIMDVRGRVVSADAVFPKLLGFTAPDMQTVLMRDYLQPA